MRALIIKVVLSSEGPYVYSLYVRTHCPKGIWEACAVDWGIAMLCTWAQRAGFSDFFYSPEDHFSSSPNTARCFICQCNILLMHTPSIFICKTEKKKLWILTTVSLAGVKTNWACHNLSRGLRYVSEHEEGWIWHLLVLFLSPDECQWFLQNDLKL